MIRWAVAGLLVIAMPPADAVAQDADSTAIPVVTHGDTLRFTLELGIDVSEYIGHVREVINPRGCLYVRLDSIRVVRGREVYSFSTPMWPTTTIERLARRDHGDAEWETIRGRELLDAGIRCLEGNSLTDAGYLNPDSR